MKIKFKIEYLAILATFSGKNDVREHLNGFHIKPHPDKRGVILTATDGKRLVTIYDEYGLTDDQYIFPITKELLTASKKKKTKDKRPLTEIQIIDDKAYVLYSEYDVIDWFNEDEPEETDRIYHVEYISNIGGGYPNTKRIFENIKYEETSTVCVNPYLIGDLSKICTSSACPAINIMFCGVDGSIVAVGGFEKEIVALIMPFRGEKITTNLPDFVEYSGGLGRDSEENPELENIETTQEDVFYEQVLEFVSETGVVSISSIQRKFRIGYNRAARLVEEMENNGVISAPGHDGSRTVLTKS